MKKVSDIFLHKNRKIISVTPDDSVIDALKIMAEQNIGSIMVMKGDEYLGLLTERDYARKVILRGKASSETKVSEIMSVELPKVNPSDTIEHCMQLMTDRNIRYLPVFDSEKIYGIVSINDLVKETIRNQEETISQLKH